MYNYNHLVLVLVSGILFVSTAPGQTNAGAPDLPRPVAKAAPYNATAWNSPKMLWEYLQPPATAAPGDVFSPAGVAGVPAAGTPVISDFTRNAGPGRSIQVRGAGITVVGSPDSFSDTRLWIYSQNSATDGQLVSTAIAGGRSTYLNASLSSHMPYGMYLAWVQNANGASYPVRVNATDAWWVGPDRTIAGATASAYGRNLSHGNGESTSYVYLRPWGAGTSTPARPVPVSKVNPYKVTFQIPTDVREGDYEVWIHNGHGGEYGWSGPLALKVEPTTPFRWAGAVRQVTSYGARPDDGGDDTSAIEAALSAAQNGDTIYFPAGRFTIGRKINVFKAVSIEGAGAASTTIEVPIGSLNAESIFYVRSFPTRFRNVTIRSQVLNGLYGQGGVIMFDGAGINPTPAGAVVENSAIVTAAGSNHPGIGIRSLNHVVVTGNTFTSGYAIHLDRSFQAFVQNNTINGNWPDVAYSDQAAFISFGSHEVDISGNLGVSPNRSGGETLSRFFVGQGHSHGAMSRHYVGENETRLVGCRAHNCGEQILFETPGTFYSGRLAWQNGATLGFSGVNWAPNYFAEDKPTVFEAYHAQRPSFLIVQKGTGEGQYRRIVSNTANTITIDHPWEVAPDTSSTLTVITAGSHAVVYKNRLDGWPGAQTSTSATAGIQTYGAQMDSVIANNTIARVRHGIWIAALNGAGCGPAALNTCPNWGLIVSGNSVTDSFYGIRSTSLIETPTGGPTHGPMVLNVSVRDNSVSAIRDEALMVGDGNGNLETWDDAWQHGTIVEHNTVANSGTSLSLRTQATRTLVIGNQFSSTSGGTGVRFHLPGTRPTLRANQYSSGMFRYTGALPGAGHSVAHRRLHLETAADGTISETIQVANAGVPPLSVSVQSSAPWLSASFTTNQITDESTVANLLVTARATGLTNGAYTAKLVVSGASGEYQSQTIGVTLVVGVPTEPTTDTKPPTVSITAPASGSTVSGQVTIGASAIDDGEIADVQFQVDGVALGPPDTTSPYSASLDTRTLSNGAHIFSALARDAAGNTATATLSVTVSNVTVDTTAPSITGVAVHAAQTAATVSWLTSEAAKGLVEYGDAKRLQWSVAATSYRTSQFVMLSGLTPGTTYKYRITATDAAGNSSQSAMLSFSTARSTATPVPEPAPATGYRKRLTVNSASIPSTGLTNFPVLVNLAADADLAAKARQDGSDIAFAAGDGTPLKFEIEKYDASTGQLVAWVNIPLLLNGSTFYVRFGGAAVSNDPSTVWSSGYAAVWHINDSTTTQLDSTPNRNNSTSSRLSATGTFGKIGLAASFRRASSNFVQVAGTSSLRPASFTIEAWALANRIGSAQQEIASMGDEYLIRFETNGGISVYTFDGAYKWATSNVDYRGALHYVVATFDAAQRMMRLYVDGVEVASAPSNRVAYRNNAQFWIGTHGLWSPDNYLDGTIDEVRVSSVVRDAAWIRTSYSNQNSPSSFLQVGALEQ